MFSRLDSSASDPTTIDKKYMRFAGIFFVMRAEGLEPPRLVATRT
jgi:hypothetical protein